MLELEEALSRILASMPAARGERIPLDAAAVGRVLVEPVHAAVDLPGFDNSSMDGYAVRAAETREASPGRPAVFRVAGKVAAGGSFSGRMAAGECIRIFTGSPLPEDADAVVMQENTREDPHNSSIVEVLEPVQPGENVRFRGGDIHAGSRLADSGDRLSPGHVGLLAAAGARQVTVGVRPKVGVLATGSELKECGQALAPGEIYESNREALAALVGLAGGLARVLPPVPDSLEATRCALASGFGGCDLVVSCGGVSVGEFDFVKRAFESLGGKLGYWKVAIKPGKPFVFGELEEKFLFGLPGNPVSAIVTFHLLVRPAIRRWQGAVDVAARTVPGVALEPLENPGDRRHFFRVHMDASGRVRSAGKQASHVLGSLAAANALVDVPPRTALRAGDPVTVILWD